MYLANGWLSVSQSESVSEWVSDFGGKQRKQSATTNMLVTFRLQYEDDY